MLKLYGYSRSRSVIVEWYLEELNIPYENVSLELSTGEHKEPEFLAINPIGKVPAIVEEDFKLWESGAILLYLAEKHGKMPESLEGKSQVTQWVFFANSTLSNGIFTEANREKEAPRLLTALNTIFTEKSFVLGDDFTVADVAVGSVLAYIPIMLQMDLSEYPAVENYIRKITQRPCFKKTIGSRFS